MCYLIDSTSKEMESCTSQGQSRIEARNNAQVYKARDLTRAFSEYYALKSFQKRLTHPDVINDLQTVLRVVYSIYGFWCIERHLATFYQGGFVATLSKTSSFGDIIRSELLRSCGAIKDSAVSIVDALAPPDFALNSVIGKSDGLVSNSWATKYEKMVD